MLYSVFFFQKMTSQPIYEVLWGLSTNFVNQQCILRYRKASDISYFSLIITTYTPSNIYYIISLLYLYFYSLTPIWKRTRVPFHFWVDLAPLLFIIHEWHLNVDENVIVKHDTNLFKRYLEFIMMDNLTKYKWTSTHQSCRYNQYWM